MSAIALWKRITMTSFRLFIAVNYLIYGGVKIFPGQFSSGPFVFDSSKDSAMSLAWHFFGYSPLYNLFIACGELAVAILLVIPRTATLGAACCLPIALNIMVIDYAFGIPALDIAAVLAGMCMWLLFAERAKLFGAFFASDQPIPVQAKRRTLA
ncbi:hypothetical protein EDM56_29095 [Brevibacillus fluminis]|uniref:DoxX family membrane protein n=1 Tax=Brevibacillus fluminis TaxID=511487 RepID=A0A3M8CUU2_9BACL|nr:hypothetical protein [Brevibacillus fluminis]RNB79582.1 hypothetical protein EDM56_29095 [Brevibacillus fluminis]